MTSGAPVPSKLLWQKRLRGADLTHAEYRVLMTISTYTDSSGRHAHPGWTRIIEDARVDRATARRAVKTLVEKEWLALVRKGGNEVGYRTADEYALALPAIHKGVNVAPEGGESDTTEGGGSDASKGCEDHPPSDPPSDDDASAPSSDVDEVHHQPISYVLPASAA